MEVRRKVTAALRQEEADRRAAESGKAKLLASRTFRFECRRLQQLRLARHRKSDAECTAPKGFDAADLGQGAIGGGTVWHRKNRFDLFSRVCLRFPRLPSAMANEMERAFRLWDAAMSRQHSAAWGHDAGRNAPLVRFC